jgi:hypothetical protein
LDLFAPAIARGQNQHRHGLAGLAPLFEDANTVHLRQAEIEHDGIVGLGGAHELALLAVTRPVDGVALASEAIDELTAELGIVLDDEHAHGRQSLGSLFPRGLSPRSSSPVAAS